MMPLPGSSPRWASSQAEPLLAGVGSAEHAEPQRVARERAAQREHVVAAAPSCSATSATTRALAVAVVARTGVSGRQRGEQVADAPVVGAEVVAPVGDAVGLVDHEQPGARGELGQLLLAEPRVVEPLGADQQDVDLVGGQRLARRRAHSSALAELIVTARMPARSAAATWSRIRASSGDTITRGPGAAPAQQAVATK